MSDVEFYVRSLTKRRLGEAYVHLKCRLDRLEPELARLRRMADAYAKSATDYRGTNTCAHCRRFTYPGTAMSVPHAADCDVAIHLGLHREKGEGE